MVLTGTLNPSVPLATLANLDADGARLINAGLENASFESSSAGWRANNLASSVNLKQYRPGVGYPHDGEGYLEMNASQPGGSVAQDVKISTQPGQSWSFSVWLRAAPNVTTPISGTVALWGLGGTQESGSTNFTVNNQEWTLVIAPLDVQNSGHTSLRAEIYMNTTGANLDADGARLINAGLENASFESSSAGWRANNLASSVNLKQYRPGVGYPHDGEGYLEMNTSQPGGSVAQDVKISTQPGQSWSFSVWLRAAPNVTSPISGTVALWGLGGTQESGSTNFTVNNQEWTLVTAPLDVQNSGHTSLRAEIYMNTAGANLDADGACLINAGLENASFESSSAGWRANNLASSVNLKQYRPGVGYPDDGEGYLEMNTSIPGGSVAQDVKISTQPGQSWSFSVWLRAAPNVTTPISGTVALWGLGGTQESSTTNFIVNNQGWTLVTAPLDVQNSGHTSLRAEIYMITTVD